MGTRAPGTFGQSIRNPVRAAKLNVSGPCPTRSRAMSDRTSAQFENVLGVCAIRLNVWAAWRTSRVFIDRPPPHTVGRSGGASSHDDTREDPSNAASYDPEPGTESAVTRPERALTCRSPAEAGRSALLWACAGVRVNE